jgi:competence protein ComEA
MKNFKKFVSLLIVLSLLMLFSVNAYSAKQKTSGASSSKLININKAGVDELVKLPRIGPKIASRIIDFRKKNGNFKKIEDLMKVTGIGEKTFNNFKDKITVK